MVHQANIEKFDEVVANLAKLSKTENKSMSKEQLAKVLSTKKFGMSITPHGLKNKKLFLSRVIASPHSLRRKAKMIYLSKIPMDNQDFLKKLEEMGKVTLNEKKLLQKFVIRRSGEVVFDSRLKKSKREDSDDEDEEVPENSESPNFYYRTVRESALAFSEEAQDPVLVKQLYEESDKSKPLKDFQKTFLKVAKNLFASEETMEVKAKFCFIFGVQLSPDFLKKLKKVAEVETTKFNQIRWLTYENDGEELYGEPVKPTGKTGIVMDDFDEIPEDMEEESDDVEESDSEDEEDFEPLEADGDGESEVDVELDVEASFRARTPPNRGRQHSEMGSEDSKVDEEPESASESRPTSRASSNASSIRNLPGMSDSEDEMDSEASEFPYNSRSVSRAVSLIDSVSGVVPEDELASENVSGGAPEYENLFDCDYDRVDLEGAPESQPLSNAAPAAKVDIPKSVSLKRALENALDQPAPTAPKRIKFEFEYLDYEHPAKSVLQKWYMVLKWVLDLEVFKDLIKEWKDLVFKIGSQGPQEEQYLTCHEISTHFKRAFRKLDATISTEEPGMDSFDFMEELLNMSRNFINSSKSQEQEELWKEIGSILEHMMKKIEEGQVFNIDEINKCFSDMARDINASY